MKSQGLIIAGACALMIAGCTNNPYTGEQQAGKSAVYGGIGALTGAAIGAATSSSDDRAKGALIGAAVGGAAGGGYGYYVDKQEQRLRQELTGTGVQVIRNGDTLQGHAGQHYLRLGLLRHLQQLLSDAEFAGQGVPGVRQERHQHRWSHRQHRLHGAEHAPVA